ncbi:MAG TPA: MBL fold metallo-hydrolase [Anaeromyxobacteraceae bacterium]|nr:MBL fold metallo-hydrolase [Anaeromyxobacteraceae bacterium]
MLALGRWRLAALLDGTFAVDGGVVFGVVPRALWERQLTPDAWNRVRLAARCLLAVDSSSARRVLVDGGLGDAWDARRQERFAVDRSGGGLDAALASHGLGRADVTDVVLTHLHLDHAGGTVRRGEAGRLELAFPRATHHVQRRAWAWAHAPSERDARAFLPESFALLEHSGRLHLVEGEGELVPDLELIVSEGHTVGQQLPRFHGDGTHLTHCGDVIPTRAHLRPSWVMALDQHPLTTIEEKKVLLAEALEEDGVLFFEHDPEVAACRLQEEAGHPAFREPVAL